MIFKIKFADATEYAQAKSQLHLLQEYHREYEGFLDIEEVTEVSDEEAKSIMIKNTDYDKDDKDDVEEMTLFDTVCGDDFVIVASTEWA